MEAHLQALGTGPLHAFATWKRDAGVPRAAAGVYALWWRADQPPVHADPTQLVYVGHARVGKPGTRSTGLWSRLAAHASGRRSGDQLAIYIADRFILPQLTADDIREVAAGNHRLDHRVRDFVAAHLAFRWVETPDGNTARRLEATIRAGRWAHGKPLLNPA
jgi:hypothetical protein